MILSHKKITNGGNERQKVQFFFFFDEFIQKTIFTHDLELLTH